MKRLILFLFLSYFFLLARSQCSGQILYSKSVEPLAGATITLYSNGNISGLVANKEGKFSIATRSYDSIRVSMVGYHSKTISPGQYPDGYIKMQLELAPAELEEVIVKKPSALDIVRKAIANLASLQTDSNFENKGFYREIIKDRENYFS